MKARRRLRLPVLPCAAAILVIMSATSCVAEHDDYFTQAEVTLTAPDSIALLQTKATATITCLTNRYTWTTAEWDSLTAVFPEVMRGPYAVSVDGKVAVSIAGGKRKVYRFRGSTSYVEVMEHPARINLEILLMQ